MLRGINLGKRQLKKEDLIAAAEACGYTGARTLPFTPAAQRWA